MKLKQYLSAKETNDLLFVGHLLDMSSNIVEEWDKFNNMTTTERKYLKTAVTYTEKFMKEVLGRMPQKEVEKFMKRTVKAQNEPIRIIDSWMRNRILGTYDTEYEIAKIERPQLEKLAFAAIEWHCKDCDSSYSDCDIYDVLEDNLIPRCEKFNNCPYRYESEEAKAERLRLEEEKRESKENKSKRKKKKHKNRYDEDEEVYTYNTK